jgi:acyl-CoA synthetase (AMP-forming)/AMP-acid ligase II
VIKGYWRDLGVFRIALLQHTVRFGPLFAFFIVVLTYRRLPNFAVPVMILFLENIAHNVSRKILKSELRKYVRRE